MIRTTNVLGRAGANPEADWRSFTVTGLWSDGSKPWHILVLIPMITGIVFGLSGLWEFWLEELIMPHISDTHNPETFEHRVEFVVTGSIFALLASVPPTFLLLHSIAHDRQATAQLRISENRLREAQKRALVGHWELKLDEDRLSVSEQVLRNLGINEDVLELRLDDFLRRVHSDDRSDVMSMIDRARREHRPGEHHYRTVLPDGEIRTIHTVFEIEFDGDGRQGCIRGIDQDVTTYVKAQQDLQDSLAQLRQLSQAQQKFVASAAHELRTPLAVLKAQLDSRRAEPQSVDEIEVDLDRAIRLVNQLVDAARYDSGPTGDPEPVDMVAVATDVIRSLGPLAVKGGKSISLTAEDGPVIVMGFHDALAVALRNLVENALAYTPSGTDVDVRLGADGTIDVADQGGGIPADERVQVFERFWRGSNSRGKVGSGLGLAMVAEIVDSHGGSIVFDDNPDGGTVFTMKLKVSTGPGRET